MNIELMEELKQVGPKRSYRSIAWLVRELDMAIEAELNGFIEKYVQIKLKNGEYDTLYKSACRLKPAYEIIKYRNPELAEALKTIFTIEVQ